MKQNSLKNLYLYSKEQETKVRRGILYSILNKLFDLAPPVLIGIAIDIVVEGSDSFLGSLGIEDRRQQLIVLAFLTFIIWALESTFDYVAAVTWRNISQDVEHSLRTDTFKNVLGLDLQYFENKSSGRLMAVLNDDVNQLEKFLDTGANKLLQTLTTVVVIGGTFLYISPLIAIFAFIPIPIIIFGSFKFTKTIASRYTRIRNAIETLNANLSNSLSGVLTVKSFNREEKEFNRILTSSTEVKSANYHAIKLSAAFIPIIRIAILFGFTATLLIGGFMALDGEINVAMYSVLLFITQRLLWPLTELGDTFDLYQRAMASFKRINALKNTQPDIQNGSIEAGSIEKLIALEDVNFSYVDNFPVLNDVSINIKKGSTTAIVGSTGSGKSTLIKLLLRLYDVKAGKIKFDDIDIKDLNIHSLRKTIGLVSQDIFLFEGTVFENIAYGNLEASNSDIWKAAKLSESDEFINLLPNKEDTIVGERGQKLSGGQRQRISIARAILKNPEILILDEATSAVDNETEAAIQRSLDTLKEGRTVIAIAHRLSTIRNADIIYVLEKGQIVESGTHEELVKLKKVYANLWDVQTGKKFNSKL
ncbi:MAG: ABC transporter ATP-binding protein [Candidatus Actinomarina sp.]|jgi:ATP-binding cassette subfamily B protein|nr:ABC transporter [Actinomycetota bacterium]MBT3873460.1 ABC transporter ATP-binding protein [Actinomycetota bacterium]MBT5655390.1 ABC transporter ATP-binding protein [Actinomycetota bacterium]MBT7014205.1 ABC transporter ATP-binding protein [Actinomycetota bacterium]RPH02048.1 MAG: ABC transporter ATP-binding protein [bacterium TMED221]|tara:strand:- start:531 stop:2303 length:1773 start_codon:yes stop_codon:yes gene_type:complete